MLIDLKLNPLCSPSLFLLQQPPAAVVALLTRKVFNTPYDHIGVIVKDRFGVAHVCENTMTGVKLRRFDQRICWSKSDEVMALPLEKSITEETRVRAERYARSLTSERKQKELKPSMVLTMDLAGLYKYWRASSAADASDAAYIEQALSSNKDVALALVLLEKIGLVQDWDEVTKQVGQAQLIGIADLQAGRIPLVDNRYRVGQELLVRKRDRSTLEKR